jgi:stearoyl-CoA desaturase (delta-9 desaturase)
MQTAAHAQARGWRQVYLNPQAIPYWLLHVGAIVGVAWLGWSWRGVAWALGLYAARMFFVTGGYHRYFAHRSYKTSRWFQFVLAVGATATAQKGVLWWAAHHRRHHKGSDTADDLHSPFHGGFWWSHMGWILARDFEGTDHAAIKDFARYPELRWLDRWWIVPPIAVGVLSFLVGGWFGLVWAFAVSQVLCWHGTFTINSLSHLWGGRRYASGDDSRNNPVLAIVTLGEGWHNNHHHYQVSARQGFFWWEVDITYTVLRVLAVLGIVSDLHGVPEHIRQGTRAPKRVFRKDPPPQDVGPPPETSRSSSGIRAVES